MSLCARLRRVWLSPGPAVYPCQDRLPQKLAPRPILHSRELAGEDPRGPHLWRKGPVYWAEQGRKWASINPDEGLSQPHEVLWSRVMARRGSGTRAGQWTPSLGGQSLNGLLRMGHDLGLGVPLAEAALPATGRLSPLLLRGDLGARLGVCPLRSLECSQLLHRTSWLNWLVPE